MNGFAAATAATDIYFVLTATLFVLRHLAYANLVSRALKRLTAETAPSAQAQAVTRMQVVE